MVYVASQSVTSDPIHGQLGTLPEENADVEQLSSEVLRHPSLFVARRGAITQPQKKKFEFRTEEKKESLGISTTTNDRGNHIEWRYLRQEEGPKGNMRQGSMHAKIEQKRLNQTIPAAK
ncbi:uncharacterized protein LOC116174512 [Photinus pyralis]|uniref:uncharacterized protein LOC116174512 n=1 Tax=Photinus pyralis TaxID=7054 RepID=UPI0012671C97|nr:uncharacterized protein LOC116174512 [Photinus pyralis]